LQGQSSTKGKAEQSGFSRSTELLVQLDDNDPKKCKEAQRKLEGLAKIHFTQIVKIVRKELSQTNGPQARRRLKEILLALKESSWEKLPEAPIDGRYHHSTALWDSKVIIWGGESHAYIYGDGAILDLQTGKWLKLPETPIKARYGHTGLLWGSQLIIWGGHDGHSFLNDGAILDLEKMEWKKLPPAPIAGRYNHSTTLWGSKLLIWGW
jgi:hypothetical protein